MRIEKNKSASYAITLNKCGKHSYNSNYLTNNGIRSAGQVAIATMLQINKKVGDSVLIDYKNPDVANSAEVDIAVIRNNEITVCIEYSMNHFVNGTDSCNFITKEYNKCLEVLKDIKPKVFFGVYSSRCTSYETLQKLLRKLEEWANLHTPKTTVILLYDTSNLNNSIYRYTSASFEKVEKDVDNIKTLFNIINSSLGYNEVNTLLVKQILYMNYEKANGMNIEINFFRFAEGHKSRGEISRATRISEYMLHMLYEDECNRIINEYKNERSDYASSLAANRSKNGKGKVVS